MSAIELPGPVQETTPSSQLIYAVLDSAGPLSVSAVVDRTGVSRSGATAALQQLRDRDLVVVERDPGDRRRRLYSVADSEPADVGVVR